jgi:molybdenum cofactor cytidylyltransferase
VSDAPRDLRLAGLVLAAGRSQRMGALKQTLPWPAGHRPSEVRSSATIVSCAYDSIASFCHRMFVVVGLDAPAVLAALEGDSANGARSFTRVDADSDDEMFASIRIGLTAIVAHESSAGETQQFDGALLHPGDHPGAARSTIEALLQEFVQAAAAKAVMPEYRGKGGHPVLVPRAMCDGLIEHDGNGGLRQFWLDHPDSCARLALDDPLCVLDLNTPTAYRRAIVEAQGLRNVEGPAAEDF